MKKSILFLDDDKSQLVIYKNLVRRHLPDYQGFYTNTVAESEKILSESNVELAVLDLMIPKENGADLIMKMKANAALKDIKIMVVSSAERNSLIFDSLSKHIDDFVTKPVDVNEFASKVKNLIG